MQDLAKFHSKQSFFGAIFAEMAGKSRKKLKRVLKYTAEVEISQKMQFLRQQTEPQLLFGCRRQQTANLVDIAACNGLHSGLAQLHPRG